MSTHVVNWLLPEAHWEILLTRLFGAREMALTCLSALQLPAEPGHILAAHTTLLTLAAARDRRRAAETLAATTGHLYGPGSPAATPMPCEDPARAAALLDAVSAADPVAATTVITRGMARARARREAWQTAAILAAAGDDDALQQVRALSLILGWAAGSEERRKELRHRYLAAARRWCGLARADPRCITIADLLGEQPP